jgi:hypothetical protein
LKKWSKKGAVFEGFCYIEGIKFFPSRLLGRKCIGVILVKSIPERGKGEKFAKWVNSPLSGRRKNVGINLRLEKITPGKVNLGTDRLEVEKGKFKT